MIKNKLITLIFLFLGTQIYGQFKRSYFHYLPSTGKYQTFVLIQPNESIDLIRAEIIQSGELVITTNSIDKQGEIESSIVYTFNSPGATGTNVMVTGAYDNGNNRILTLGIANTYTMNYYVLEFNKSTGIEVQDFLHPNLFNITFINSIKSGTEYVQYALNSTNGVMRLGFNEGNFSTVTSEIANSLLTSIGGSSLVNLAKDAGKVVLFNGKEISCFVSGTKQITERSSSNTYINHTLSGNASNVSNLLVLPNGNLFVHSNGDLFELNSSFAVVHSNQTPVGTIRSAEVGIINNKIHFFIDQLGQQQILYKTFDLSFNLLDSTKYFMNNVIDLRSNGTSLFLLGNYLGETQVNASYTGTSISNNTVPSIIDCFKISADITASNEFHFPLTIQDFNLELGLGNQFFPTRINNLANAKYQGISVVYNLANVYTALSANNSLTGTDSGGFFKPVFLPGPFTTLGMYTDKIADQYNRGFFVTREMIENHLDSVQLGNPNYKAPYGIHNWPAHGEIQFGQAANLAPFVDIDGDGTYEPYQGDYPAIFGDNCFFSITHDNPGYVNSASIETHSFKYWFNCDTSEALKYTIFHKTYYFSRQLDFTSFQLGTFSDFDLGNYNDDYSGTNVELGLIYQYNGDIIDESNAGYPSFGNHIPAAGIILLKGTPIASDGQDNAIGTLEGGSVNGYGFGDSIVDNECFGLENSMVLTGISAPFGMSDPMNLSQFNNYLQGFWQYGDQVYFGGTGFPGQSPTTIQAKYLYPGNSDPIHYGTSGIDPGFTWTEFEPLGNGSTSNPSGDRRFIGSTKTRNLMVGDTAIYEIAFVFSNDTAQTTTVGQATSSLFAKASLIKNAYAQNSGGCGASFNPIEDDLSLVENPLKDVLLYPNPTNNKFMVSGLQNSTSTVTVYDMEGRLLTHIQFVSELTEISLKDYQGSIFLVTIRDGSHSITKRLVKY